MVDRVLVKESEWVQPGQPVVELVRIDRLRLEAFLNAYEVSPREVDGQPVVIEVPVRGVNGKEKLEKFTGVISFVSPVVVADGAYRVSVEFENRKDGNHWAVQPGLTANMSIKLGAAAQRRPTNNSYSSDADPTNTNSHIHAAMFRVSRDPGFETKLQPTHMITLAESLVSSTSRPVKLRMRPDLDARRQKYQGQAFWVVKEPVGLNYFRFHEEEYAILQMLDGRTSLEAIKERFEDEFTPQKITFQDLQQFIGMLHRSGLVISEASGQGKQLKKRRDEKSIARS